MPRLHTYPWRGLVLYTAVALCGVWLAAESAGQQPSFLPSGSRTRAGGIDARPEITSAPVEMPAEPSSDEAGAALCTDLPGIRFVPSRSESPSQPSPSQATENTGFGQWQEGRGTLKMAIQELKDNKTAGRIESSPSAIPAVESKDWRSRIDDSVSRLKILNAPGEAARAPRSVHAAEPDAPSVPHPQTLPIAWPNQSDGRSALSQLLRAPSAAPEPARDSHASEETWEAGYAEAVGPSELKHVPLTPSPPEPPPILRNKDDQSAMNLVPTETPLFGPASPSTQVAQQQQLPVVQLPPYRWEHLYPGRERLPEAPPWKAPEAIPSTLAALGAIGIVQEPGPAASRPAVNPQKGSPAEVPVAHLEPRESPPQVTQGSVLPELGSQASASSVGPVAAGPDGYYPVAPPSGAGIRREPYVPLPVEGYAVGNSHRYPTANRAARGLDPTAYGRSPGTGVPGYGGAGLGSYGPGSFSYPSSAAPISTGLPSAGFGLPGGAVGQIR